VMVKVVTAVVMSAAEGMRAVIFIVAVVILDQVEVIINVIMATIFSRSHIQVPLHASNDLPAAVVVVAIISIRMNAFKVSQQPVTCVTASVRLLSPLSTVLRPTANTNFEATEITSIGRLVRLLVHFRAFLVMVIPPVRAVVMTTTELVTANILVVAIGFLDERVVPILHVTLLPCGCMLVVPFLAWDDVPAALTLVASTLLGILVVALDFLQEVLVRIAVMRSKLVPALARRRVATDPVVVAVELTFKTSFGENVVFEITFIVVVVVPVAAIVVFAAHVMCALLLIVAVVQTNQTILLAFLVIRCDVVVPIPATNNIPAAGLHTAT
jgi:hypothetical protein